MGGIFEISEDIRTADPDLEGILMSMPLRITRYQNPLQILADYLNSSVLFPEDFLNRADRTMVRFKVNHQGDAPPKGVYELIPQGLSKFESIIYSPPQVRNTMEIQSMGEHGLLVDWGDRVFYFRYAETTREETQRKYDGVKAELKALEKRQPTPAERRRYQREAGALPPRTADG